MVVPGNHDLDNSGPQGARISVTESVLRNPELARDASVVQVCTAPQDEFYEFQRALADDGLEPSTNDYSARLYYEYNFKARGHNLRFVCINTAWLSHTREKQGQLFYPPDAINAAKRSDTVSLAIFHHPDNWLESNNARAFRARVRQTADVILTGHEHEASYGIHLGEQDERNQYIEGGPLQDSYGELPSAFNALVLDTARSRQKVARFAWNGRQYVLAGGGHGGDDGAGLAWEEFPVNRSRLLGELQFTLSAREKLADPGLTLHHKDRGDLKLPDIFIFPDLTEITPGKKSPGQIVRGIAFSTCSIPTDHC